MQRILKLLTSLTVLLLTGQFNLVFASQPDVPLTIDYPSPIVSEFNFENDNNIYPDKSNFKILNAITMSNTDGERWATLTIKNAASGRRIFKSGHILALFADGNRAYPLSEDQTFDAKETISLTLQFSNNSFPILKLYTRSN